MKNKDKMLPTKKPAGRHHTLSRFFADKDMFAQITGIVILSISAVMSMAFSSIQNLPHMLIQPTHAGEQLTTYEGVLTFAGTEITLKTHERTYQLRDPNKVLNKAQHFEQNSSVQSFRVCIEGERSPLGSYGRGHYPYQIFVHSLCHNNKKNP